MNLRPEEVFEAFLIGFNGRVRERSARQDHEAEAGNRRADVES